MADIWKMNQEMKALFVLSMIIIVIINLFNGKEKQQFQQNNSFPCSCSLMLKLGFQNQFGDGLVRFCLVLFGLF